jgi:hypothetical protein
MNSDFPPRTSTTPRPNSAQAMIGSSRRVSFGATVANPLLKPLGHSIIKTVSQKASRTNEAVIGALVPTFQKISEDLLYGFLAVDIGGLWLFRIANSLIRGRKPYDATKDPDFKPGQSELSQINRIVKGFTKGVNLPYFVEEAYREFLVGPVWLAMSATTFGAYKAMMGNGMRMSMGTATLLSHTLMNHLHHTALPTTGGTTPVLCAKSNFIEQLKPFISNLLPSDGSLKSALLNHPNKPLFKYIEAWTNTIQSGLDYRENKPQLARTIESIMDWVNNVVKGRAGKPNVDSITQASPGSLGHYQNALLQLRQAEQHLKTAILAHQHTHHPILNGQAQFNQVNQLQLKVQKRIANGLESITIPKKITAFLHEMDLFRDITMSAFERYHETPHAGTLAQMVERQLETVSKQKLVGSVLAIGMLFYYTRALTEKLQSHKTYPGNDNRRISDLIPTAATLQQGMA